jgi:DNA-binding IclR family transcriptional regulator
MQQKSYSAAKTVQKALRILESLGERQPLRPSDIARQLSLSRSNIHRLLSTLEEMGYVERRPDATYCLGFKVFMLGSNFITPNDISDMAYPLMKRLADISQENVNLGVLYEQKVLYLNKIKSPHNLKLDTPIGKMDPLHCTGLGKILLSGFCEEELKAYFSLDFEELEEGVNCIAAPIYDHKHQILAAISVSAPSVRLTNQKIKQLKAPLIENCTAVSKKLGYCNVAAKV